VRYLQLAHNEWDPATRTSRPRVLYSFGRADHLGRQLIERLVASLCRLLDPAVALSATTATGLSFGGVPDVRRSLVARSTVAPADPRKVMAVAINAAFSEWIKKFHRPPALQRHHRPAHLQRVFQRHRHRVLPAQNHAPARQPINQGEDTSHDRWARRRHTARLEPIRAPPGGRPRFWRPACTGSSTAGHNRSPGSSSVLPGTVLEPGDPRRAQRASTWRH